MRPEAEDHDDMGGASEEPGGKWGDQSTNAPQNATTPEQRGLAPTDLTALPEESRELIAWLARRKMASLEEMEGALNKKRSLIASTLEPLLQKGYVLEMIIEGVKFYRVVFHGRPRRSPEGLAEELWNRLDLDEGEP